MNLSKQIYVIQVSNPIWSSDVKFKYQDKFRTSTQKIGIIKVKKIKKMLPQSSQYEPSSHCHKMLIKKRVDWKTHPWLRKDFDSSKILE